MPLLSYYQPSGFTSGFLKAERSIIPLVRYCQLQVMKIQVERLEQNAQAPATIGLPRGMPCIEFDIFHE